MKKSPVLIISDPHFHGFKAFATLSRSGLNTRLGLIQEAFFKAVDRGTQEGCRLLAVPGDIFHIRGRVRPSVLNVVYQCLVYAQSQGMEIILLAGNHDMEDYRKGDTAIDAFRDMDMVHVANDLRLIEAAGWKVLCIPYIHDVDEFKEAYVEACAKYDHDIVLIHQGVDEFRPDKNLPETQITAEFLQAHSLGYIVAGHYHVFRQLDRVFSPGSIVPHNFGDAGTRCFVILQEEFADCAFYASTHPHFITCRVGPETDMDTLNLKGNFARITVTGGRKLSEVSAHCEKSGCLGVNIFVEKEYTTAHEAAIKFGTPAEMFRDYLEMKPNLKPKKDRLTRLYRVIQSRMNKGD